MTEHEWLTCKRPRRMLYHLGCDERHDLLEAQTNGRQLRLWCAALAVRAYGRDRALGPQGGYASWAEGEPALADLEDDAAAPLRIAISWAKKYNGHTNVSDEVKADLLREIVGNPFRPFKWCHPSTGWSTDDFDDALPGFVLLDYRWRTETVRDLAKAAWDHLSPAGELDTTRLAVLADALEEAGCVGKRCRTCVGTGVISQEHPFGDTWAVERLTCYDCAGIGRWPHPLLEHLRSPGPHVRGCWALDLVLLS
ncbi:MAG: hypothetical protein E6G97_18030 [Alphaproteobacteria bacterium]|nr:MAG: hypothetical protein E6G97_18030 [Alphaproteobacteria bacterium]